MADLKDQDTPVDIGIFGKTKIQVLYTHRPWDLPVDALVVPASADGGLQGGLATALRKELGSAWEYILQEAIGEMKERDFGPTMPAMVKLVGLEEKYSLQYLIIATAFHRSNKHIPAAATEAVLKRADKRDIRTLALPLLGSGAGGQLSVETAEAMYDAIMNTAPLLNLEAITITTLSYDAVNRLIEMSKQFSNHEVTERFDGRFADQPMDKDNRTYVSRFLADNPGASVEDLLDIGHEVTAFAHLAATRNVFPPLSIGIFGEWGSGKTFFMERIYNEIRDLTNSASSHKFFHSNIVQIRFNAWHYIETNLWASLVDAIFQDLDCWLRGQHKDVEKLFEQLTTSKQLQLEAVTELIEARKRKLLAESLLNEAIRLHQQRQDELFSSPLPNIWTAAAVTFSESLTTADRLELKKAGEELGLPQLQVSATNLAQVVKDCHSESQRIRLLGNSLLHKFGSPKYLVMAVATVLLVPFCLEALRVWLSSNGLPWLAKINASVLGLASAISTITAVIGNALKDGRCALNVFEKFCKNLEDTVEKRTEKHRQVVADAEKKLAEQAQKVAEAERMVAVATDEATAADRLYENDTARGRLNRFIKDRVADGTYARHLGLIATIRKDFAQLAEIMNEDGIDELMAKELKSSREAYRLRLDRLLVENPGILSKTEESDLRREIPASQLRHFERIVLYIDDLDRCPPDKVAEVLQAIHMLLFFPLFVVVVAVDARWVTRSLETEFPHLLIGSRRTEDFNTSYDKQLGAGAEQLPATALDYLEKIFQIPFWVRPMTDNASKNFVGGLTKGWVGYGSQEPDPEHAGSTSGRPEATRDGVEEALQSTAAKSEFDNFESFREAAGSETTYQASHSKIFDSMTLTTAESELLKSFACFLGGSPRRAKRFVNLFLLIKTCLGTGEVNPKPDVPTVNNRALITLLAVVTGAPHVCEAFFRALPAPDAYPCDVMALQKNLIFNPDGYRPREENALRGIVQCLLEADGPNGSDMINALHAFAPTVQRYSFQGNVGILDMRLRQQATR